MRKTLFVVSFFFAFIAPSFSQTAWWVFFTDKNGTTFDPYAYFAPEAIDRRNRLGISLYDSTDFPVQQK
ncbi:MAG TPA: hypothetical protein VFU15_04700, partial [Bacteroidia bacterium]|nr:hypothetical protein [Bacteroidia bacterium]